MGTQVAKKRSYDRCCRCWVLVKMSIAVARCQEIVRSTVDEGVGEVHEKSMAVGVEVVLLILGLFVVEESLFVVRSHRLIEVQRNGRAVRRLLCRQLSRGRGRRFQ